MTAIQCNPPSAVNVDMYDTHNTTITPQTLYIQSR
jgi:hypothetical protein